VTVVVAACAAASRYAVVRSVCAVVAVVSAMYWVPHTVPGGKPETEVPGKRPTSPAITDEPVLVMALPAKMAKLDAVPRLTDVAAAAETDAIPKVPNANAETRLNATAIDAAPGRRRARSQRRRRDAFAPVTVNSLDSCSSCR
jgi:hypothetical protein